MSQPPSRRREPRTDVVTYRVHVELTDTGPPLWRRLELVSDMRLDELHDVLQVAFGWTDSHLHRFGVGTEYYSRETEYYLMHFEVEEGEEGIPEEEVRLDEVLVDVGDQLFYVYDFGDDWEHTVRLEAVLERGGSAPRAVCTSGGRPGPAEDCGGVTGYELYSAATDATHPQHAEARTELALPVRTRGRTRVLHLHPVRHRGDQQGARRAPPAAGHRHARTARRTPPHRPGQPGTHPPQRPDRHGADGRATDDRRRRRRADGPPLRVAARTRGRRRHHPDRGRLPAQRPTSRPP